MAACDADPFTFLEFTMPRSRRRSRISNPAVDLARLWFETGTVMTLRMSMLAFEAAPNGEAALMFDEKQPAFAKAASDATTAALSAITQRPFDPLGASLAASGAWTRSVTRKARGNRRRLMTHGKVK